MNDQENRDPLLDELEAMFGRVDAPPEHVVAAAVAAPEVVAAWRDLDAGLLFLLDDTALQADPVGVRSGGGPRLVTFGTAVDTEDGDGGIEVEVEVGVEPSGTLRLVGLVVPTGPASLDVRHPGGSMSVDVDDLGRFRAAGVPAGPLSLVLHLQDDRTAATEWVTV